jgi:hypothetical protein
MLDTYQKVRELFCNLIKFASIDLYYKIKYGHDSSKIRFDFFKNWQYKRYARATMALFQVLICFCFWSGFSSLSYASENSNSIEKNISIKGNFKLSGAINYQFQISDSSLKSQSKKIELSAGLSISISSINDKLIPISEGLWFFVDNGDGLISGQIQGQLDRNINSELISSEMMILSQEIQWLPFLLDGYSYKIEINQTDAPFIYIPSEKSSLCGPNCKLYQETRPQQELYIVLGNYTPYSKEVYGVNLGVALHQADKDLAESYLQLLPDVVARYSQMIGKYPFSEFWVIENLNETGYGMPGFTLLGKSVIRLPFLLKSSLPHEVLHNWLGNSIFVDYQKGNWCEGLTTHLADHYEQKISLQDSSYRRNAILDYINFVSENVDFPLIEFQGRHSGSTQAVGYDKSMMLFQMIQDYLGEKVFYQRLQNLFQQFYFQQIGFEQVIKNIFLNDAKEYTQWLPWIKEKGIVDLSAQVLCEKGKTSLKIKSSPNNLFYRLEYLKKSNTGTELAFVDILDGHTEIELPKDISTIHIDPSFKVFRKLSQGEKPLALSEVFGKKVIYVVVDEDLKVDFDLWKEGVQSSFPIVFEVITSDEEKSKNSKDLIIHYSNKLPKSLQESGYLDQIHVEFKEGQLKIQDQNYPTTNSAWAVMGKGLSKQTLLWVKPQPNMDSKAWGRQLTHYTQMGVLIFKDRKNVFKNTYASGKSDLEIDVKDCK